MKSAVVWKKDSGIFTMQYCLKKEFEDDTQYAKERRDIKVKLWIRVR